MAYFLFFIFLLLFSILEYYIKRDSDKNKLFIITSFFLICFCSFRYGVGFDYFNYQILFNQLPQTLSSGISFEGIHGEPFFLALFLLFRAVGVDYEYTNSIITTVIVLLFLRFINRYSTYKVFSLLILYSWFCVYIFSLLRQGLAMGIVLVSFSLFQDKKYIKYSLVVLLASFFHTSAIIAFLFPFASKIILWIKKFYLLMVLILVVLLIIDLSPLQFILSAIGQTYYSTNKISISALLNRILPFVFIYFLCKPKDKSYLFMKDVYLIGFLLYLFLAPAPLIASRAVAYFKIFEIVLFCSIQARITFRSYPIFISLLSIYLGFMLMSIVGVFAKQQGYNMWNYPYATIFNKEDFVVLENNESDGNDDE